MNDINVLTQLSSRDLVSNEIKYHTNCHTIDQETTSRCGGREELQADLHPHLRLQGG